MYCWMHVSYKEKRKMLNLRLSAEAAKGEYAGIAQIEAQAYVRCC